MRVVLWVVAGVLAVNVLAVGWFLAAIDRYRSVKMYRVLSGLWRHEPRILGSRANGLLGKSFTVVALLAVIAYAGMTLGAPRARQVLTSALEVVVPVVQEPGDGLGAVRAGSEGDTTLAPPNTEAPPTSTATSGAAIPITVTATPHSATAIVLSWADVADATSYQIDRRERSRAWEILAWVRNPTFTDAGLDADTTYYYRVSATTSEGEAPPSDVTSATTPPDLATPNGLTAVSASTAAIVLSWNDVADETGYRIERSVDRETWVLVTTTGTDVNVHTDEGLSSGTTYFYRVVAVNAGGESPASDVAKATTGSEPTIEPGVIDPGVIDPGSGGSLDVSEPAVIDAAPVDPAISQPIAVDPALSEPIAAEPAAIEPAVVDSAATEPVVA